MNNHHKVDILLATYEGERFIKEQLDSLFNQTHKNFHIYVRDDLSKDKTVSIVEDFIEKYPQKITLLKSSARLGVKANFSSLMNVSNAPYVMFCDQDDVWLPNKIEKTLDRMIELEVVHKQKPLLVHTDLAVVDENLKIKNRSFWNYIHVKPSNGHSFNRLLSQNVVTGCTVMVNRLLVEIARPIPNECFMHDWWLALVASAFGRVAIINESLMLYRQHGKNTLGAKKFGHLGRIKEQIAKIRKGHLRNMNQALHFYHRYHEMLEKNDKTILKNFIMLSKLSWAKKRWMILKCGFYKEGFLRDFADFILG